MSEKPNIATMDSKELAKHIAEQEDKQRRRFKALRSLCRALEAEEDATDAAGVE